MADRVAIPGAPTLPTTVTLRRHETPTYRVETAADLSSRSSEELAEVARRWAAIPGQGSGISWSYFLMLSGAAGVKADRMIRRFVAEALERADEAEVSVREAIELVTAAAERLGVSATSLDHQIWLYQRARGVG